MSDGTTFTRAEVVAPGEKIVSRNIQSLALAINDRIEFSEDIPWRLIYWLLGKTRGARNPSAEGAYPAVAEVLETYMHVDPKKTSLTWPEASPGANEGANVANPLMAFVFGNALVDDEYTRLLPVDAQTPAGATVEGYWSSGISQSGVFDPNSGAMNAPAFEAAQAHQEIQPEVKTFENPTNGAPTTAQYRWQHMGKSFGGSIPVPERSSSGGGLCADGFTPNYLRRWRWIGSGSAAIDPAHGVTVLAGSLGSKLSLVSESGGTFLKSVGSCGSGGGDHLDNVHRYPFADLVTFNDGTIVRLGAKLWVEGPYEHGGRLAHTDGEHLTVMMNWFNGGFRGSDTERAESISPKTQSFDFETFFTSQYPLAPNRGVEQPGGSITAVLPTFVLSGETTHAAGTLLANTAGGDLHDYLTGFVIGKALVQRDGFTGAATVELLNFGTVIDEITLPEGEDAVMVVFKDQVTPSPLQVRLKDELALGDGEALWVQCTEQVAYKPEIWDAGLVLRLSATKGDFLATMDGAGYETFQPKRFTDVLFSKGCISNPLTPNVAVPLIGVNGNPGYEASRQISRGLATTANRHQLIDYRFDGTNSKFRFKRHRLGLQDSDVDIFDGLAPNEAPIDSGDILPGIVYIVRGPAGQSLTYNGVEYDVGETFTGVIKVTEYTGDPDCAPYEHEGIRSVAPPGGWTNEWVMFLQTFMYSDSESSFFKYEGYGDHFALNNGCHFQSTPGSYPGEFYQMFQQSVTGSVSNAEAPTGFNFAATHASGQAVFQNAGANADYARGCRMHKRPARIKSAISYTQTNENVPSEFVEITIDGRIDHLDDAPATVPWYLDGPGYPTSINDYLDDTGYEFEESPAYRPRSAENAIMEYLRRGSEPCHRRRGDYAWNGGLELAGSGLASNVHGACVPRFFFTRLARIPWVDTPDNDTVEPDYDTHRFAEWMSENEIWIRVMCEAFLDGQTTVDYACASGVATGFTYTHTNLCIEAFGNRWASAIDPDLRPDNMMGLGPMPMTYHWSETFNQFAQRVNLLTRIPIVLPFLFEGRRTDYAGTGQTGTVTDGSDDCSVNSGLIVGTVAMPTLAVTNTGSWEEISGVTAFAGYGWKSADCDGDDFLVQGDRTDWEFRVRPSSTAYEEALPDHIKTLLNTGSAGVIGIEHRLSYSYDLVPVYTEPESSACDQGETEVRLYGFPNAVPGYRLDQVEVVNTSVCTLKTAGSLSASPVGSSSAGAEWSGLGSCGWGGAYAEHGFTPITDSATAFVEVPLVDMG